MWIIIPLTPFSKIIIRKLKLKQSLAFHHHRIVVITAIWSNDCTLFKCYYKHIAVRTCLSATDSLLLFAPLFFPPLLLLVRLRAMFIPPFGLLFAGYLYCFAYCKFFTYFFLDYATNIGIDTFMFIHTINKKWRKKISAVHGKSIQALKHLANNLLRRCCGLVVPLCNSVNFSDAVIFVTVFVCCFFSLSLL